MLGRLVLLAAVTHDFGKLFGIHVDQISIGANDFAGVGSPRRRSHTDPHFGRGIVEEVNAFMHAIAIEAAGSGIDTGMAR